MAQILLAEDDDSMRAFLARGLERAGYDVHAAGNGLDALTALLARRFDMLVADIVMPGLDGIELARRASAAYPEMPVLLITGFAAVALQAHNAKLARARVVSKPVHLRDLVSLVNEMLPARA
jgi:two-component system, cell cycle response regulator CpdR